MKLKPQLAPLAQTVKLAAMPALDQIILPFRVLARGHLFLVCYLFAGMYSIEWARRLGIAEGIALLRSALNPLDPSPTVTRWVDIIVKGLGWYLAFIAFVALLALPNRYFWTEGKIPIFKAVLQLPQALLLALRTMTTAVRYGLVRFFPAIALMAAYTVYAEKLQQRTVLALYAIAAIAVVVHALIQVTPLLLSPIVAVCMRCQPMMALSLAHHQGRRSLLEYVAIIVATAGLILVTRPALFWIARQIGNTSMTLLVGELAIIWYGSVLLCFAILRALTATEDGIH